MTAAAPNPAGVSVRFLGWRVAALATIAAALSGPGQTIGVAVFVDPMIETLALTRSEVSTGYLVGTLVGAGLLVFVGRWIDRVGTRTAMSWIGLAFGFALLVMAGVQGIATLTLGFILIRWLGQGSLMLVSQLSITPWFERRRGFVFGLSTTATASLIALTPVLLGLVISGFDWRLAWVVAAVAVWLVVLPIARLGIIDRPSDVGQYPDGDPAPHPSEPVIERRSMTRRQALRQVRFWVLGLVLATTSMLVTALNFHQISILGEQGLTLTEAAAMFLPQIAGTIVAGLIFGTLADRVPAGPLLAMTMVLLGITLLLAASLQPGLVILAYAVLLGAAAGSQWPLTSTIMPRWYGLANIGAIQGFASLFVVGGSALGPVLLAVANDGIGGYGQAAWVLLALPLVMGLAALTIRETR